MCVGIPMKLTAITGNIGTVEEEGVCREVGLDLLEAPQIGSYVIVHAGYAIEQLDPEEAQVTLDLLRQVHILPGETEGDDQESSTSGEGLA
jgi:hydrogenase expression/formation protein HypC